MPDQTQPTALELFDKLIASPYASSDENARIQWQLRSRLVSDASKLAQLRTQLATSVRKATALDMLEQMESDDFAGVTLQTLPTPSQFDDGIGLVNAIELAHEEYRKIAEEEPTE